MREKSAREQLSDLQMKIAKLSAHVLEERIEEFTFTSVEQYDFNFIREDMIKLRAWADRNLAVVDGVLGYGTQRQLIDKMRETNGRTPEEAEVYQERANQIEQGLISKRSTESGKLELAKDFSPDEEAGQLSPLHDEIWHPPDDVKSFERKPEKGLRLLKCCTKCHTQQAWNTGNFECWKNKATPNYPGNNNLWYWKGQCRECKNRS